jgi:hypothetical protein
MKDFFKFKSMKEEHGAGDIGTPSLVAKYKTGTPGQTSAPPTRQPARKGDKLNAVMAKEKKPVVKENNEIEKSEMAETQLYFISYAAEEIIEYIGMGGEIDEWYQNKLSKAHSDMEGLHSHIEGEKRRTGMVEESTVDEGDNKQMKGKDPCWKGYQMVGTKKKGGKPVPNCVPTNEASYKVDVEGLPTMYIDSKSPSEVKSGLRKLLRKPDSINSVERVMDADVRKAFRLKAQGKEESVDEGLMKNVKRFVKGTDATTRAGSEINKAIDARHGGDSATADKHYNRFKKLNALTKQEEYKSDAQRKAVWASRNEKLDPSQGAGEYVKDFEKSDAPQFKGKNKKERQKMAVAAYLSAKRGD